jgi:AraC family transcriptional regulator
MSQEQPLTVDFTQKDTLLSVLPCLPIASSHAAGWDKIQLAHYLQPPHIIPEHWSLQHIICINVGNHVVLEQIVDGRSEIVNSVNTEIGIYPANLWQTFRWDRETEFLQLYLEPKLLKLINEELCGSDCVELIPQLTSFLDPLIHNIGLALKSALEIDGLGSRLYAESMANALAVHLLSRYSTRKLVVRHYRGLSQQQLKQVTDYINEYLDQDLSLAELAAVVQLSAYHFARLFKQSTGVSPHQYLIRCRVERAKQLLLKSDFTIAQIALAVGFASQPHLNYHFKRLEGMTPKTFMQQ